MPSYTVKSGAVSGSLGYACQRKIVRKSNSELWCTYYRSDGTRNQIYVAYSIDGGQTWTEEQVTAATSTNHQYLPAIAVDSNDNIHLVWYGKGWGNNPTINQILYNKRTSSGWQGQELVTDVSGGQSGPVIAVDSSGNAHVIWTGRTWGTNVNYDNLQYRKRTSESWQTREAITDKPNHQGGATIAIDSSGNIHLAWRGPGWGVNSGYSNVQYRKRTSEGWQSQEGVTDINNTQGGCCIVLDTNNNVHLVWYGKAWGVNKTVFNIQYRQRTAVGWQVQEAITDSGSTQGDPTLTVDVSDNLHLIWFGKGWGSNPGVDNVQYNKRTSENWGTQVGLTNSALAQQNCNAFRSTGEGYGFVWMNYTTVTYYASDDLSWEEEELVLSRVNEKWGW